MENNQKNCCHQNCTDKQSDNKLEEQTVPEKDAQIREEEMRLQTGLSEMTEQEKSN